MTTMNLALKCIVIANLLCYLIPIITMNSNRFNYFFVLFASPFDRLFFMFNFLSKLAYTELGFSWIFWRIYMYIVSRHLQFYSPNTDRFFRSCFYKVPRHKQNFGVLVHPICLVLKSLHHFSKLELNHCKLHKFVV